ncbi:MAG: PilC/PilY family type IV pilus protein [Nitrosomonadales bacterium]|nr:PilC/PilY family type IV pilus protein [Nitrosomonadales bacterium]
MKHNQQGYAQMFKYLLGMMLLGSLMLSGPTRAAGVTTPLDMATIPLANSPTVTIQPNLLFVLDDSGSMEWNFMPDQFGYNLSSQDQRKCRKYYREGSSSTRVTQCSGGNSNGMGDGGDPPIYSYRINTVYYNPGVYYEPPVNPCNFSAHLPSQTNWSSVRTDGLKIDASCNQTTGTTNLVTQYPERVYCDVHGTTTLTALSKTSGGGQYMCKQNGVDQRTPLATYPGDYDYPETTGDWYASSSSSGFGTYIYARDYNSNPHYYNVIPREHCTDKSLVNCILSAVPTTDHPLPAYVRYCNTDAQASSPSVQSGQTSGKNNCQAAFDRTSTTTYTYARYGNFQRVDIVSSVGSYPKALARTDCAGVTCTYTEEMTNFANWYAYYRTRMQMMQSSVGLAFKDVGEDFRVGFMTIKPASSTSVNFNTFNTAHKSAWYKKLYSIAGSGGTPLRQALGQAGRIYAKKESISGAFSDPIEYECQQNFTLLTTDGFWNGNAGVKVDGSVMTNQDGDAVRPKYEGPSTNSTSNSLADTAKYYRDTDLRTGALSNCVGALGENVCQSPSPSEANKKQSMVTLTLGLGVDGTLAYITDYKTATSGDFFDIKTGSKDWPKPVADSPAAIDDLWHAAVNGDGTYFSAKDPAELTRSMKEALASIEVKLGAGAAAATSTLNPVSTDNDAYVASYTTGHWTGNLEKRTIDTVTGAVSATTTPGNCVEDVVVSASCDAPSSIVANGTGGYNCVTPDVTEATACTGGTWDGVANTCSVPVTASCTGKLKNKVLPFDDTRKIYKNSGSGLVDFTYSNLTTAQKTTFEPAFLAANLTQWSLLAPEQQALITGENLVNYLRGQTGLDENAADPANRIFRKRQAVLGDVINAAPAFIGKPTFSYVDYGYDSFKSGNSGRTGMVYVASNDGMLHAFDANTLEEKWAYVPSMVIQNLWKLADTAYDTKHSYYVDGDPIISDICVSGCGGAGATWKTILVGGLNAGGRGYYALDITNPASPSLLWEFDADDEPNLGYTFGTPVVTKDLSGKWVVLVTSGYNNIPDNSAFYALGTTKFKPNNPSQFTTGDGKGYLYILDAMTGSKMAQISTELGTTSLPSGLAQISAYAEDAERNNTTTYVYGGDLTGNFWRFDLSNNSVMKLAAMGSTQPITTAPEIGLIKKKRVIFVGTGKYLEISDLTNTDQQTLYAIKDDNATTTISDPRNTLVQQSMAVIDGDKRESTSNNAVNWDVGLGWYINLPDTGERQHVASSLILGTLLVPTTVPTSSACQPAGYGWFTFLDYRTGRSVIDSGLVSTMTSSPVVGFNVVYIDGKPKVSIVTADNPTPQLMPGVPFSGSGSGFNKVRSIWRELIID